MNHLLTLDLPDELYEPLLRLAQDSGRPLEAWIRDRLKEEVDAPMSAEDPLLKWAGAVDCDVSDVAERHDDYLGQSLLDKTRGER